MEEVQQPRGEAGGETPGVAKQRSGLYDNREKLTFLFNSKLLLKRNSSVLSIPDVIQVSLLSHVLPFSFFPHPIHDK